MKIKFFTLGGTIDKVYFDAMSRYEVGPPRVKEILKEARVNFEYSIKSLAKKDSLDMTDADRKRLVDALLTDDCDRIVVTHGTDTMVDTAMALKAVKGKTIVLTGAMEPAGFKSSDATFNLGFAIAAAQTLSHGVYIAISGRIFDPARVRKNRELKQFEEK
ncbi:AspG [Desulforapulum autotrophicum HRM2]|uniref:AspG n=1 Tax=Desulforapulum autotrophicum (strain ATCC 43914 / DSM 3382 / VKM B-1955 / HRM2) TaxID=177437 RepID=C0QBW3_DESAH|nr:asparaginase domain-containing protein [Desulforapulum autotrophicum]ACN14975.1 AspG [Desulforapulum autotrophicum HRM2]